MKQTTNREASRRQWRRVGTWFWLPLATVLLMQAFAQAQTQLKIWRSGETLTAADLNMSFAQVRSQMLTGDAVRRVVASLDKAPNGGESAPAACDDGYALLTFGLTRVHHTNNGINGWDLGGNFGCRADAAGALVAFLENYEGGSPNTRIDCTGLCVRGATP